VAASALGGGGTHVMSKNATSLRMRARKESRRRRHPSRGHRGAREEIGVVGRTVVCIEAGSLLVIGK